MKSDYMFEKVQFSGKIMTVYDGHGWLGQKWRFRYDVIKQRSLIQVVIQMTIQRVM